uniref:Uncharacterized protein n=1 Tax=Trieres chinensis TaxID=1514140 RepID=A0A7S2EEY4_TRICV|mmetsp:Transcript_20771/g.41970  ORF Transcript_20771/g.41970 Transcript_20771/m.41970 type:complete len:213 (+) Transcript_20771:3-641(+)
MHPSRVLRAAGLGMRPDGRRGPPPPAAALHLYDPDSDLSASLDLYLEGPDMAGRYGGTKFLRGSGRSALLLDSETAGRYLPRIRPDGDDLPALVAVRNGEAVASVPLRELGSKSDGRIEPAAVRFFLEGAGVLRGEAPSPEDMCRIRPEEEVLHEVMMREKAAAEAAARAPEPYNCGVKGCNKMFRHEHVGVDNEVQEGLVVGREEVLGEEN